MLGRFSSFFRSVGSQRFPYVMTTRKMTQRTYEEGAPWPPLQDNTLRLYSMRFCPYAHRSRLVLAHKNIDYETVNVHLKRKPSWLLERNPRGRVPVLEHPDGRFVLDSLIVSQYIDEIYPADPLTPADPYQKAHDQLLPDFCNKLTTAIYQLLYTEGESEEAKVIFRKGFTIYEAELNRRLPDGPFFGGTRPAMVDYMIWPWFERLPQFTDQPSPDAVPLHSTYPYFVDVGVIASQFPRLHQWMSAMFELPAVKATMFDLESHTRFSRSQLTADPEYDMGLEGEPPVPSSAKL